MAQPSLALAWLNAVHLISQSSLSEWRSRHLEHSLPLSPSACGSVRSFSHGGELSQHTHIRTDGDVQIRTRLHQTLLSHLKDGWSWSRMEPAIRAFKGEGWMDHNSCGTLLDWAVVDGHYVEPGVMTKLWCRHQSFHTMRSIWTDINSIKQITADGGDKDLSGLMRRCMASSRVNTLWHAIFLQQICSANKKEIFLCT